MVDRFTKKINKLLVESHWVFHFDAFNSEFNDPVDEYTPFFLYFRKDYLLGEYDPLENIFFCRNIGIYGYRYHSWFRKRLRQPHGIRDMLSEHFGFTLTDAW